MLGHFFELLSGLVIDAPIEPCKKHVGFSQIQTRVVVLFRAGSIVGKGLWARVCSSSTHLSAHELARD